jgi:hypothetical protein
MRFCKAFIKTKIPESITVAKAIDLETKALNLCASLLGWINNADQIWTLSNWHS